MMNKLFVQIAATTQGSSSVIESYGVSSGKMTIQFILILFLAVINLIPLFLGIRALIQEGNRWEVPLWSFLCLIFPIIMPLIAFFYFQHRAKQQMNS